MSHRRPDPRQAGLEIVLRSALRLAGDSVEPAADGLDRIRAKISTRQPVQAGWAMSAPSGLLGTLWRWLEPAVIWLRYMAGAIVDRFRPDPDRAGRLGWLRPAAALATGVFVVAAASWVITALPAAITPANNSGHLGGNGPGGGPAASSHSNGVQSTSRTGIRSGRGGSPQPSRSCSSGPAKHRPTKSTSPSTSSSPSPSPSTSSSPSPSPSPSSSTPSPSGSPSTSVPTTSPGASSASAAAQVSAAPSPSERRTSSQTKPSATNVITTPTPPARQKRCG